MELHADFICRNLHKLCAICGKIGRGDNLRAHMGKMHSLYPKSFYRFLRDGEIPLHFGESLPSAFIEDKSVTLLGILDAEAKKQGAQGPGRFAFIIAAHKSQWAGRLVRGPQSEPAADVMPHNLPSQAQIDHLWALAKASGRQEKFLPQGGGAMEMQPDHQPYRAPVQHGLVSIIDGATKALQEAIAAQKFEKLVTAKRHRKSLEVKNEVLRCNQRRHKREVKRLEKDLDRQAERHKQQLLQEREQHCHLYGLQAQVDGLRAKLESNWSIIVDQREEIKILLARLAKYAPRELKDMGEHWTPGEEVDPLKWQLTRKAATDEALIAELQAENARLKQASASARVPRGGQASPMGRVGGPGPAQGSSCDGSAVSTRAPTGKTFGKIPVSMGQRSSHSAFPKTDGSLQGNPSVRAHKQ